MKRSFLRSAAVALSVPLLVVSLWLVRGATASLSDAEVRHGVQVRGLVVGVDGDHATVRIPRATDDVVTTLTRHHEYAVGDTIPVLYDPVDPRRASEVGAPAPSTPIGRSLVVAAMLAGGWLGCWMLSRRREDDAPDVPVGSGVVRGGRVREPQPVG